MLYKLFCKQVVHVKEVFSIAATNLDAWSTSCKCNSTCSYGVFLGIRKVDKAAAPDPRELFVFAW